MQFLTNRNGEIRGEETDVFFAQLTSKILRLKGLQGDLDVQQMWLSYSYGQVRNCEL